MPTATKKGLKVGDKAPAFNLPSTSGKKVALKDLKGKNVVLYFYPKDDTPGCTKESCGFRDNIKKFTKQKTVILGVSFDNLKSHQKFIDKYDLPFELLSDEDKKVAGLYDVYKMKQFMGKSYMGIERSTFWIKPDGKIGQIWRKVKVDGHIEDVLSTIENA